VNRSELINISNTIFDVLKESKKVKLNYLLNLNKTNIDSDIKMINDAIKTSKKFEEFEQKRIDVCLKYCEKNDNGEPIIINEVYQGLENNKTFNDEFGKIKEKYKTEIDERQKQLDEYNKLLKEDVEFEFNKIDLDLIPDDLMNGHQQAILTPLFKVE